VGRAQGSPDRLVSLTVSVWLEYDRPGALYIYQGELPPGTPLPARLTFRLPRQPSSTAGVDEQGHYRYVRPLIREEGDGYVVSYDVNWPRFQLEYYDDALHRDGTGRKLKLSYRADCAVEHLVLAVKEPYGALEWSVEPAAHTRVEAEDGLTEHRRTIGPVAAGDEVRWEVAYSRSDSRLSVEALGLPTPPAFSGTVAAVGVGRAGERSTWMLVAFVGVVVASGVALGLRSDGRGPARRLAAASAAPAGRSRRGTKPRGKAHPNGRLARYCHQCGTAMGQGDLFCRRCGTRRRGA
jgi:hypothetical protein